VNTKPFVREGREVPRRKTTRINILPGFSSRFFASFADKKGFPA